MASPVIQSIQHTGTTLYIIWDVAVSASLGSELNGFTFVKNPGAVPVVPVFSSIDENAMICTIVALAPGESLVASYASATGTVVDAATGTFDATDFTDETAVAYYSEPFVIRAQVAATGVNDELTIFFSEPVGSPSGAYAGFTIEVDGVAISLTAATFALNNDQTELTIKTGSNFTYNDVVDIDYDDVTGDLYSWPSGVVASFSFTGIDNSSTDGLPDSDYPLSTIVGLKPTILANVVIPVLQVSLNPIDIELVSRYGPATIVTGGTFGTQVPITIVGRSVNIIDGLEISERFTNAQSVVYAAEAANEWQTVVTQRIGVALGELRAVDQSVVLNSQSVHQV
jgi:hypothetical protein